MECDMHELLAEGNLDKLDYEIYYRLVKLMRKISANPQHKWIEETPEGLYHEFWIAKLSPVFPKNEPKTQQTHPKEKPQKGKSPIPDYFKKYPTDGIFMKGMESAMEKWLSTYVKKTLPAGFLIDSLRNRMKSHTKLFESVKMQHEASQWTLKNGAKTPTTASMSTLTRVAQQCDLHITEVAYGAKRGPNLGRPGEMEHLLAEVLRAANGTMTIGQIATVVGDGKQLIGHEVQMGDDGWNYIQNSEMGSI